MFLENSRYFGLKTVEAATSGGRKVIAVTLRRLPFVAGTQTVVKGNDRLDVIAQRRYADPTMFWHIADANTELEANRLIEERAQTSEARTIIIPEK
ncbi:MAG TPA: hypothetical protein VKB86_09075 [Pyrinomonadaceae bacterium]|nr:hypothetical protein [Pyrinomonadaceae bacterium]